jgi:signal transduction histidine kinase
VTEAERVRRLAIWLSAMRVLAVPFAVSQVLITNDFPTGYRTWAWVATTILAVGAVALLPITVKELSLAARNRLGAAALVFDTSIVVAFMLIYSFENGQAIWAIYYLPILEGALRFGLVGGIGVPLATAPLLVATEIFRADRFEPGHVRVDVLSLRIGLGMIIGGVIGRLVTSLVEQGRVAETRAAEAERLGDELGRRVDLLDAANRCARALGSSLELEQAFNAFIRELQGLVPFDRLAIVLAEGGDARVIATAGAGSESVFPPGTSRPVRGSVLERVLSGETVVRPDMTDLSHPEEEELLALGLRSRLAAPLMLGARAIGMLSLVRAQPEAFGPEDRELVSLLGRLVATAVQNIRAYEAERETVEELRRLSALRADFVSLVSHELRSPMAAVIGAARTLQERWRQLTPDQRQSFLALIADETSRLAALISDVLDASRIEAGTFSFTFSDVDMAELVEESAAVAELGQDEVRVRARVRGPLPFVRGDRERLRQVLSNLVDNAIKHSNAGDEVEISAVATNGNVMVDVRDQGPGVALEHQKLIFEKFGRAKVGGKAKPGTGLGLFIARSIAEAHGGSLEVRSAPGQGATFTLALPGE